MNKYELNYFLNIIIENKNIIHYASYNNTIIFVLNIGIDQEIPKKI